MSGSTFCKLFIIFGCSHFGGSLFTSVIKPQGIATAVVAAGSGMAVGAYAGLRVTNDLDEMIGNAKKIFDENDENKGVIING